MKKNFLISVASAALIGVSGIAYAQAPGGAAQPNGGANAPSAGSGASQSAPAQAAPAAREESAPSGGKTGQAVPQTGAGQRAQGNTGDAMKSKGTSSEMNGKATGANESKGGDRAAQGDMKTNSKATASDSKASDSNKAMDSNKAADSKASDSKASGSTTGQAAGGGKQLTTEQRTTIRTSVTNVKPVTNVNFSISVGSRVPRGGVEFHPLPAPILVIYPDYRGYEFIRVNDQILIINPRTLEIVAVLEA